jgi:hypothetical protein
MECPFCGGEMRAGVLTYRGGFRESVLAADAGLDAYRELLFGPDDTRSEIFIALTFNGLRRGYRCDACRAVLISGEQQESDA